MLVDRDEAYNHWNLYTLQQVLEPIKKIKTTRWGNEVFIYTKSLLNASYPPLHLLYSFQLTHSE